MTYHDRAQGISTMRRRLVGAILPAALAAGAVLFGRSASAQTKPPRVKVATELGDFVVEVYPDRAPISANNFLAYVDKGLLDGQSAYRIVTIANQPADTAYKIEVIQFGWRGAEGQEPPLPRIAHETTDVIGLKHLDGTLSMARLATGTASAGFFICIGDQPSLDFGGGRHPDRQGFAAFGRVIEGMDVVRHIHATRAEPVDRLAKPIAITRATRMPS
ncbi:peptidylprolyl isomerase [Bosea sp. 685]|uniref:peptidylprolyl isomerase n=1 Tax=Bosea sp. 685 TaxID=3080057 RepID=UPI0028929C38|nr:peptidylprolyl isomerase [Bosea sp. 685]WNJ91199.1 peptidylprolyl isomerase [Bosea sp. 685]